MQFAQPTILKSLCHQININIAFEAFLFSQCRIHQPILFLWQNDKTIVIGRHQNPWKECNLQAMKADQVWLQRRNSGGGAVYQDLGNHCFTFLNPYQDQNPKTINNHILLNALNKIGVKAEPSGRNDILAQNRKISGSAYQLSLGTKLNPEKIALHHGTMLIDVDFGALGKYLTPTKKKLQSKGVDSVAQRVINLREINEEINVQKYEAALVEAFKEEHKEVAFKEFDSAGLLQIESVKQKAEQLSSWDWLFGYAPEFSVNHEERFSWGSVEILLNVEKNVITESKIYSDCLNPDYITKLTEAFPGKRYDFDGIEEVFKCLEEESFKQMNQDLKDWLKGVI